MDGKRVAMNGWGWDYYEDPSSCNGTRNITHSMDCHGQRRNSDVSLSNYPQVETNLEGDQGEGCHFTSS